MAGAKHHGKALHHKATLIRAKEPGRKRGASLLTCSLKSCRRTFMHSQTTSDSPMSRTKGTASPVMTDISTDCFPCTPTPAELTTLA